MGEERTPRRANGEPDFTGPFPLNVVCILHGGHPVRHWLADVAASGSLDLTLNDPLLYPYHDVPATSSITRNPDAKGFAENVNSAIERIFKRESAEIACVVNFDLEMAVDTLHNLVATLIAHPELSAVGAVLRDPGGAAIFSVGTWPTPLKEFLRASGLRSKRLMALQRWILRHSGRWSARNTGPQTEYRTLGPQEYLPWTCIALRRSAWTSVGALDERYPLYAEDIDWGMRCHRSRQKMAVRDCGTVIHFERATRGPRADSMYEISHLELHRKWGWELCLRWQLRGLALRRRWPLRRLTVPLEWSLFPSFEGSNPPGQL